jgi:hypothetical protein
VVLHGAHFRAIPTSPINKRNKLCCNKRSAAVIAMKKKLLVHFLYAPQHVFTKNSARGPSAVRQSENANNAVEATLTATKIFITPLIA